jgi:hypothetical protein
MFFIIQMSNNKPGRATTVETRKKSNHPIISTTQPLDADNSVRPKAIKDVNKANWVPV